MERTKKSRLKYIVLLTVTLGLLGTLTESCHGSKKCGCGHDLNGVYKSRKRGW